MYHFDDTLCVRWTPYFYISQCTNVEFVTGDVDNTKGGAAQCFGVPETIRDEIAEIIDYLTVRHVQLLSI